MACTSPYLSSQIIGRRFSASPAPPSPDQLNFRRRVQICASYATAERTWAPQVALQTSSFYDVLGIQSCASGQEIKSAYRKLARVLHPDVALSVGEDAKSTSDEFMRVHAAYATLSDPEKRALYDITLSRRMRKEARLAAGASPEMRLRRRNWETDQCWFGGLSMIIILLWQKFLKLDISNMSILWLRRLVIILLLFGDPFFGVEKYFPKVFLGEWTIVLRSRL